MLFLKWTGSRTCDREKYSESKWIIYVVERLRRTLNREWRIEERNGKSENRISRNEITRRLTAKSMSINAPSKRISSYEKIRRTCRTKDWHSEGKNSRDRTLEFPEYFFCLGKSLSRSRHVFNDIQQGYRTTRSLRKTPRKMTEYS